MSSGSGKRMTRYLLDTHVFLWADARPADLPPRMQQVLRDPQHRFYLSLVSLWEIQIKHQLGKLTLRVPIEMLVNEQRTASQLSFVPIKLSHISTGWPTCRCIIEIRLIDC